MKILVFGAGGQVGREVWRAAWPSRYAVLPFDRRAVDITKGAVSVIWSRFKLPEAWRLAKQSVGR